MWCLPGAPSAGFVCAMEDVLDVYTRPYDPKHPTVCLDETSKQLVGEVQEPLPVAPGKPAQRILASPASRAGPGLPQPQYVHRLALLDTDVYSQTPVRQMNGSI